MIFLAIFAQIISCIIKHYTFVITKSTINIDEYEKHLILINGTIPGPLLDCNINDELIIKILNNSPEDFSLHLHGIDQKNNNKNDGVAHVTQPPIKPGETWFYHINVGNQTGTYYYHSHVGLQADSAFGSLVIHDKKWSDKVSFNSIYKYDEEIIMIFSDWYKKDDLEMILGLTNMDFKWIGNPDNILLNGKILSQSTFILEKGKIYRIRLIGATALSLLKISFFNHKIILIEVDGVLTDPISLDYIKINSGQRISVLLYAECDENNVYPILVKTMYRNNSKIYYSSIQYNSNKPKIDSILSAECIKKFSKDDLDIYEPSISKWYKIEDNHYYNMPFNYSRTVGFSIKQGRGKDGLLKWKLNDHEIMLSNKSACSSGGEYYFLKNQSYRIVLQMFANFENKCDQHPMHLHGHPFYVIGSGKGRHPYFNGTNSEYRVKYLNPILRDTVTFYPDVDSFLTHVPEDEPCGWLELLFKADNPGKWVFHCHVSAHMIMGMTSIFIVTQ